MKPTHVTITLQVSVHEGQASWRDPRGEDSFQVTVPADALDAINVQKLLQPMLAVAKGNFDVVVAELEAKKLEE